LRGFCSSSRLGARCLGGGGTSASASSGSPAVRASSQGGRQRFLLSGSTSGFVQGGAGRGNPAGFGLFRSASDLPSQGGGGGGDRAASVFFQSLLDVGFLEAANLHSCSSGRDLVFGSRGRRGGDQRFCSSQGRFFFFEKRAIRFCLLPFWLGRFLRHRLRPDAQFGASGFSRSVSARFQGGGGGGRAFWFFQVASAFVEEPGQNPLSVLPAGRFCGPSRRLHLRFCYFQYRGFFLLVSLSGGGGGIPTSVLLPGASKISSLRFGVSFFGQGGPARLLFLQRAAGGQAILFGRFTAGRLKMAATKQAFPARVEGGGSLDSPRGRKEGGKIVLR